MIKYIIILLPFIFWGCQKNFNSVVNPLPVNSRVLKVTTADSLTFNKSDSLIVVSIQLSSSTGIESVEANIIASDQTQLNDSPIILYDNGDIADNGDSVKGDGIYSNKFPLSRYNPDGIYTVQYSITDDNNNTQIAAVHSFVYNNGQPLTAPVISNLVAPDTVAIETQKVLIFLSVQVNDTLGLQDIKSVFFNSLSPPDDQPSSGNPFIMYDDGTHGDAVAGDGIYSLIVELLPPPTVVPKGTYTFEFQAVSKEGVTSNIITHYIVVQ
jgi:hypothetical protein